MLKKFIAGSFALALMLIASSALAYDFGTTTLKVGSRGEAVKNVQIVVGANPVDGIFGAITKAKVEAWQKVNGLTPDGLFGPASKAKANTGTVPVVGGTLCPNGMLLSNNCNAPETTGTPSTLTGGAGSINLNETATGTEKEVLEGRTEKVAAFRVDADGSDLSLSNLRISLENKGDGSKRIERYVEEVSIWDGSTKVATIQAGDFTRSTNTYTRNVSLSNVIVKEGLSNRKTFYVSIKAISNMDSADTSVANDWEVKIDNVRYADATGMVMTDGKVLTTTGVTFKDYATAGDIKLRASLSSNNPSAGLMQINEFVSTSDKTLLEFRLKAEGLDMEVSQIKIQLDSTGNNLNKIFSDLKLVKGSSTIADFSIPSSGFAVATKEISFDLYDDLIIEKDETTTIKVVARLLKMDGNFAEGDTITATYKGVVAEDQNGNSVTGTKLTGSASGEVQTLKLGITTVEVTNVTASVPNNATTPGTVSFTFKVKAVEKNTVFSATTGFTAKVTGTDPTIAVGNLVKISGDATLADGKYTVEEGKDATFALDYTLTPVNSGDNGVYRVTLETVAGVKVDRTSGAISLAAN